MTPSILSRLLVTTLVVSVLCPPSALARHRKRAKAKKVVENQAEAPDAAQPAAPSDDKIVFDRAENGTLFFREKGSDQAKSLRTELTDLKFLGSLGNGHTEDSAAAPYWVFSGKPCASATSDACRESTILVIRPPSGRVASFVHPGKILDPKTRAVLLDSRAYIGRCLPHRTSNVYVVYQKERVDRKNKLQQSVFIAEAAPEHLSEQLLERHLPRLQDTQKLARSKACREIEGNNRLMLNRPLDLTPPRTTDDDDGEDETKENQTDADLSTADKP